MADLITTSSDSILESSPSFFSSRVYSGDSTIP